MFGRNRPGGRLRRARVLLAAAAALVFSFAQSACDGQAPRVSNQPAQEAQTKTVQIPVEGMTCAACAARVKKALTSMGGVSEVEVSLAERRAQVRFDASRVSPDELVATIEDLGYPAGAKGSARR